MPDAFPLIPSPDLNQYRKLAKDFQIACRSNHSRSVRDWAVRWAETISRLRGLEATSRAGLWIVNESERLEQRWDKLKKKNERLARCMLADAQFFIALEHGFEDWQKFASHIAALRDTHSPVSKFEAAVDAVVSGDAASLKKLLDDDPDLAQARSTRQHHSTLLHYVSANGVESFRQKIPVNVIEMTNILLRRGADVNATSDAYAGGPTTLALVATSIFAQQAGVQIRLLQTLLDNGAKIYKPPAPDSGKSIIHSCLANGRPEAAEFFAGLGVPLELQEAAGLGRIELVKSHFDERGLLRPPATRQQMETGFLFACGYGRKDVVEFLLERNIDAGLHNAGGQTGLHWAAYSAHVDVVRLLVERGIPVDIKDNRFRATPLDATLYLWNKSSDAAERERCYEVIKLLTRAGARLDPKQWYDPNEAQPSVLKKISSDSRMLAALGVESIAC